MPKKKKARFCVFDYKPEDKISPFFPKLLLFMVLVTAVESKKGQIPRGRMGEVENKSLLLWVKPGVSGK